MAIQNPAESPGSEAGDAGGAPKNSTFSLRLRPKEFEILNSLAKLHKKSIAELAREFIRDGIRAALDPVEINRRLEEEKHRLMTAADEMRNAALDDAHNSPTQERAGSSHRV